MQHPSFIGFLCDETGLVCLALIAGLIIISMIEYYERKNDKI